MCEKEWKRNQDCDEIQPAICRYSAIKSGMEFKKESELESLMEKLQHHPILSNYTHTAQKHQWKVPMLCSLTAFVAKDNSL